MKDSKISSQHSTMLCVLLKSNNIETLSVDELQSNLLIHEQRMKSSNKEEHALKVTHEERAERGRGITGGVQERGRGRQSLKASTKL